MTPRLLVVLAALAACSGPPAPRPATPATPSRLVEPAAKPWLVLLGPLPEAARRHLRACRELLAGGPGRWTAARAAAYAERLARAERAVVAAQRPARTFLERLGARLDRASWLANTLCVTLPAGREPKQRLMEWARSHGAAARPEGVLRRLEPTRPAGRVASHGRAPVAVAVVGDGFGNEPAPAGQVRRVLGTCAERQRRPRAPLLVAAALEGARAAGTDSPWIGAYAVADAVDGQARESTVLAALERIAADRPDILYGAGPEPLPLVACCLGLGGVAGPHGASRVVARSLDRLAVYFDLLTAAPAGNDPSPERAGTLPAFETLLVGALAPGDAEPWERSARGRAKPGRVCPDLLAGGQPAGPGPSRIPPQAPSTDLAAARVAGGAAAWRAAHPQASALAARSALLEAARPVAGAECGRLELREVDQARPPAAVRRWEDVLTVDATRAHEVSLEPHALYEALLVWDDEGREQPALVVTTDTGGSFEARARGANRLFLRFQAGPLDRGALLQVQRSADGEGAAGRGAFRYMLRFARIRRPR